MKLISCHIENYGKFRNADFKFDEGLTAYCEANGYGKTTLASFLKAMFYGLDSDRANSAFNERRRFNPFAGGNFGGYLNFTVDGRIYKIERYFDEKSETKDSVTLYINGKAVHAPDNLGEQIFGIDRQSFERTIFISANEIDISSTSSINTKLNNFVEGSNDDTNLSAALGRLESASKRYKKSRQGSDLISEENRRIVRLAEAISNAEIIAAGLPEKYGRLDDTTRNIRELTAKIALAQNTNLVRNDWARYDDLTTEISKTEGTIKAVEGKYPYGVPAAEEITLVSEAVDADRTLKASGRKKLFSGDDETKFSALSMQFSGGVPTESELSEAEKQIEALASLSFEIDALNKTSTTPQDEKLRQRFARHVPAEDEIAEVDEKAEQYKKCLAEYENTPEYVADTAPSAINPPKASSKPYLILAIIFALLLAGGVAAIFFILIAGIVLLALGAVGLIAVGFLYLNKKTNSRGAAQGTIAENPLKLAAAKRAERLSNDIQAFLMPYGYTLDNGVAFAVATFKEDVKRFNVLLANAEENKRALVENQTRRQELSDLITAFFARYRIAGNNFVRSLADLRSDLNSYNSLKSRKEVSLASASELEGKITDNRKAIVAFCDKYRLDIEFIAEKIKQIADDEKALSFARKALTGQKEKAIRFKAEKRLTERPEDMQQVDLMELNGRLAELQEEKNSLFTEITNDEYEVEKLDDLRNELSAAKEKSEEYKYTYDILCKTMDALRQADGKLKDKYVKPIKDKFVYYSSLLEKTLGEKISMDTDFEIRYERNGKERSEKHLSSGQRSICALCFRLALIDNMYSEEKPFLILDDPFINLDLEHLEKVKSMLTELSEKLQIIYFACHPSRAITQ